jgi:hypothetical protein
VSANHIGVVGQCEAGGFDFRAALVQYGGQRGRAMAELGEMPPIDIRPADLLPFGQQWTANGGRLGRSSPHSSIELGRVFDQRIGEALAAMLGGISIITPSQNDLHPREPDAVEVGAVRIAGGVRPQNFDVGYRPDGVRFACDSKTLNDAKSVGKNYQNMINDLGTEATTVHTRFPYAIIAFLVAIPAPCLLPTQQSGLIGALQRLAGRASPIDVPHKAEAIALVVWNPATGAIDANVPDPSSPLRIETFSQSVQRHYFDRYFGMPPH